MKVSCNLNRDDSAFVKMLKDETISAKAQLYRDDSDYYQGYVDGLYFALDVLKDYPVYMIMDMIPSLEIEVNVMN